jgi:hypothetical protein
MKGTILIYKTGTTIPEVQEIEGSPTLNVLKAAIGGGYLEAVPYFNIIKRDGKWVRCAAFCDEDGKSKQLPVNMPATQLWDIAMLLTKGCNASPDFLVGQVAVVLGDDEFMEAL